MRILHARLATEPVTADDYVEKPFSVGALLARMRVALRHKVLMAGGDSKIEAGDIEIDLPFRLVRVGGEPVRLSAKEYELLVRLAQGGGRALTHKQLLTAVWGPAHRYAVRCLHVFIGQLRQKVEADASTSKVITTEPGVAINFSEIERWAKARVLVARLSLKTNT